MTMLRKIRQSRGLTAWDLAKRTGLHAATVSRIELARTVAYPGWRSKICGVLDVAEEQVFDPVSGFAKAVD